MEYYHLHTRGIHDREYRESRRFVVDPNKYNNRLFEKCNNFSVTVPTKDFPRMTEVINEALRENSYKTYDDKIILTDLFSLGLRDGISQNELIKLMQSTISFLVRAQIYKRENALEDFRKENCPDKPSRMHSFYLTTEEGVEYWANHLIDNDMDIYLVEVDHEPFVSNEQLLPEETLTYGEALKESGRYYGKQMVSTVKEIANCYNFC